MKQIQIIRIKIKSIIIILASTIIYGISWALVYLIFSTFHGMSKMFNQEFIWLIAGIFDIRLNTISKGLVFAFLDGSILGFLIGMFLSIIYQNHFRIR